MGQDAHPTLSETDGQDAHPTLSVKLTGKMPILR